jgi:hypothetical protein
MISGKLRAIADPFVVAPPAGARVRTRLQVSPGDEDVLRQVGAHLGRLASADLAQRCREGRLGAKAKAQSRRRRKQAMTAACSSRWAGAITRTSKDSWQLAVRNLAAEARSLRARIGRIGQRLRVAAGGQVWPGSWLPHPGGAVAEAAAPAAPRSAPCRGRAATGQREPRHLPRRPQAGPGPAAPGRGRARGRGRRSGLYQPLGRAALARPVAASGSRCHRPSCGCGGHRQARARAASAATGEVCPDPTSGWARESYPLRRVARASYRWPA